MISPIIIGTCSCIEETRNLLHNELENLRVQGIVLNLQEETRYFWSFFVISAEKRKRKQEAVYYLAVAKAITNLIVNHLDIIYLKNYIQKKYDYFSLSEQEELIALTLKAFKNIKLLKQGRIQEALYDYLKNDQVLLVDGYIRFRLREHREHLRSLISRKEEEIRVARAYDEFISLLRYFISMQEPETEEIHLYINFYGYYYLCDQGGEIVYQENLRAPYFYTEGEELNYEDHLLSVLVKIMPRLLVFHVPDEFWESDSLQAVRQVFGPRSIRCPDYNKCEYINDIQPNHRKT